MHCLSRVIFVFPEPTTKATPNCNSPARENVLLTLFSLEETNSSFKSRRERVNSMLLSSPKQGLVGACERRGEVDGEGC